MFVELTNIVTFPVHTYHKVRMYVQYVVGRNSQCCVYTAFHHHLPADTLLLCVELPTSPVDRESPTLSVDLRRGSAQQPKK